MAASGPFLYDQVMSLLRLLRADDTDQRVGIAIMLRRRQSLGRTSSETRNFSIVLPFYILGGVGSVFVLPGRGPGPVVANTRATGYNKLRFTGGFHPIRRFLFFTPMLIISGSTSQATQRPGPPGRVTRRSTTRLHWPATSAQSAATSSTPPRRPHRPSSLPYQHHRSPFFSPPLRRHVPSSSQRHNAAGGYSVPPF